MDKVTVHAHEEGGPFLDNPSKTELHDLLAGMTLHHRFVIVERLDLTPAGQHYMQVYLNDDRSCEVEYREGGPDRHFHVTVPDQPTLIGVEPIADVLFDWAYDRPGWREAFPWSPLEGL